MRQAGSEDIMKFCVFDSIYSLYVFVITLRGMPIECLIIVVVDVHIVDEYFLLLS